MEGSPFESQEVQPENPDVGPPKDQGWMGEEDFSLKSVRVKGPEAGKHREIVPGTRHQSLHVLLIMFYCNHGPFGL